MELLDKPCPSELVFDRYTFGNTFIRDLQHATSLVLIQSPYLDIQAMRPLLGPLKDCFERGVRVCVFIRQPKNWHRRDAMDPIESVDLKNVEHLVLMLESLGVHVTLRPYIHEKLAVFDGIYFWDGSLNILSYGASSERMTRFNNPAKALNATKKHNLTDCDGCRRVKDTNGCKAMTIDGDSSAALAIRELRASENLSQRKLAERAGASRTALRRLEQGVSGITTEEFASLCSAMNFTLMVVPDHAVPSIDRLVNLLPKPPR